jgi:hypothetical protein
MAIMHRIAPFTARKSARADHAPRPAGEECGSSTISCSPWEGLYLEQGNAAEAPHPAEVAVAVELDRFLDTLLGRK